MTAPPQPPVRCGHCGSEMTGHFCSNCGRRRDGAAAADPVRRYAPWVLGGALSIALVGLVLRQPRQSTMPLATPDLAPTGSPGTPPDISNLSPRERFNRLYSRIISAAQTGDQATVERFTPMALAAFGMLEAVDADARYHLAMIQLHIGDLAGAQAQADSLTKLEPNHLFGYVIDAAVARWNKDEPKRQAAYQKFLARYDGELKTNKPEYVEHTSMLAEVYKAAKGS